MLFVFILPRTYQLVPKIFGAEHFMCRSTLQFWIHLFVRFCFLLLLSQQNLLLFLWQLSYKQASLPVFTYVIRRKYLAQSVKGGVGTNWKLVLNPAEVNFINVFTLSFYVSRYRKRKKDSQIKQLLGSARVKAARKMMVKLNPELLDCWMFIAHLLHCSLQCLTETGTLKYLNHFL